VRIQYSDACKFPILLVNSVFSSGSDVTDRTFVPQRIIVNFLCAVRKFHTVCLVQTLLNAFRLPGNSGFQKWFFITS